MHQVVGARGAIVAEATRRQFSPELVKDHSIQGPRVSLPVVG